MAPQRTSDKTHYGALDFVEESGQAETRNFTLKYLVGLALVAVAVTAAVFAFTSPVSDAAPNSVEDYNNREIAHIMQGMVDGVFVGDDRAHGDDCVCTDTCDSSDGLTGTCTVTSADCVDAISRKPKTVNGALKAVCFVTSGTYDCWNFPCVNKGYCVDQVNGFKCICPFGYKGEICDLDVDECGDPEAGTVNVCAAHSTCENTVGAYGCTCNDGFYGDGYAVDQSIVSYGSVIKEQGNLPDATLVRTYGWLTRTASSTAGCVDIDDCASNPCHNGAQCTDLWATEEMSNAFSCDCSSLLPGKRFDGEFCEYDVDECTSGLHNCVADTKATCLNSKGSFTCTCNDGWEGDGMYKGPGDDETEFGFTAGFAFDGCADIDDCAIRVEQDDGSFEVQGPCGNGGTCSNELPGNGRFVCACTDGWEGELCLEDINECERKGDTACTIADSHCSNTPGDWECLCDDGYTGDPNDYCFDADDCEFSPCKNGGTCSDCGTLCKMCDCVDGYRGLTCDKDWDECALGIHQCHENGHCKNTFGSYDCECLPGYSGDGYNNGKCEKVDTCIMWTDKVKTCGAYGKECGNDSDCASGVNCVIVDDSTLVDYQVRVYDSNGFLDRAASQGEISGATWMDDKRVTDSDGNIVTQCGVYDASMNSFTSHGECSDVGQSFVCKCDDGWQDSNCDRDIDECAQGTHECARYSTCSNTDGSYECACNEGHRGDGAVSCHDIDDCTTGTGARCVNGACADTGKNNWVCQCMDGWQDSNCDRDVNECLLVSTECPGNAECVNTQGSYECECREGFTGTGSSDCEPIDDCASSPCAHGLCVDHGTTGYGCVCEDGWTDYNCDFDVNECVLKTHDCHSTPRDDISPSRCVNNPGSYYCRCISGFEGDGWTCTDMDDCDPDPCCHELDNVVPGFAPDAMGMMVSHGGCIDGGANKYHCNCAQGWEGLDCCDPIYECPECHNNAQCSENDPVDQAKSPPGFTCACNTGFYGDGYTNCNPCSDCAEREPKGAWILDPNGAACGVGPNGGADTVCMPANECELLTHNCDTTCSTCTDLHPNEGGFSCSAQGEFFSNDGACTGTTNTCQAFDTCGKGEYMDLEGDSCNDRVCNRVIPDGKYAIETGAGSVSQCLVLWAETAKVFPERYSWGGRTIEEGKSALDYADSADACPNPVCGVCDYNNRGAENNIKLGQVAAWTFARLGNDNYLILSNVDGNGYRCLGFDKTDTDMVAPYPQLISYESRTMEAADGICAATATQVRTTTACTGPAECAGDEFCLKADVEGGSWTTDGTGPDSVFDQDGNLIYFCGFDTNEFGTAKEKLNADPQTVWNVHQLGCSEDSEFGVPRWYCEDSKYDMKFVIRSLADKDKIGHPGAPNQSYNAHCLYFPDQNGGQYTNPRRVPNTPTADGVWMGGVYNGDSNDDHDCGITAMDGMTQEEALLNNAAAVFHLIAL